MNCCKISTWNCAPDGTEVLVIHDLDTGTIEYKNKTDLSDYIGDETELELCDKPCCLITVSLVDENGDPVTSVYDTVTGEQTCYDSTWNVLDPCPDLFAPAGSTEPPCIVSETMVNAAGEPVVVTFDPATNTRTCYDSQFNELDPCPDLFVPSGGGGGVDSVSTFSISSDAAGFTVNHDGGAGGTTYTETIPWPAGGGGGGTVSAFSMTESTDGDGNVTWQIIHNNGSTTVNETIVIPNICNVLSGLPGGSALILDTLLGIDTSGACRQFDPSAVGGGGGGITSACDDLTDNVSDAAGTPDKVLGVNAADECGWYDPPAGGTTNWDCETDLQGIPDGVAAKVLGLSASNTCVMAPTGNTSDVDNLCTLLNNLSNATVATQIAELVAIDINGNCVLMPKVTIDANGQSPGGDNPAAWDNLLATENPAAYPEGTDICVTDVAGFGTLFGKRGTDGQGNPQWTLFQGVI